MLETKYLTGVHYFESHVTLEVPLNEEHLAELKRIAAQHDFRVAELLMVREGRTEPSDKDAFCTARDEVYAVVFERMRAFCVALRRMEWRVLRCKIEAVIYDQRFTDTSAP